MIQTILEPVSSVTVRIRFSGSLAPDNFHLTSQEGARFYSDWESYLKGGSVIGGTYTFDEADRTTVISVNFTLISYIESGKVY